MPINLRKTAGLLAAFAMLAMAGMAGSADAGPNARPGIAVTIVDPGQKPMLDRGLLKVKVRSARKGSVRVRGFSATYDGRGEFIPLTRVAWPRFRKAGQSRIVNLRLTPAGRSQVAGCEDRDIEVKAGATKSRRRAMIRQTADCRPGNVDMSRSADCNFIAAQDSSVCMSPFPDNYYTIADPQTETGRRINFTEAAMPANSSGVPIDPAPYRSSDGFSQGQTISVRVPGLDNPAALAQTSPVGLADPSRYLDAEAPVVVLDARTRERQPIWVEIDSNATTAAATNLLIHPMVNFDPATRYIVVLRNLRNAAGTPLKAPAGFRYYRDLLPTRNARIRGRYSFYEDIFKRLRNAGIKRAGLYLAWDFTTASDENNSRRALSIRDRAFAALGDTDLADRVVSGDAPAFEVTSLEINPNTEISRRIKGTFEVPCFLNHPASANECQSGASFDLGQDGLPRQHGVYNAKFECVVPKAVIDPEEIQESERPDQALQGRAMVYGHGLMGSIAGEIAAGAQRRMAARGFTICGTDEIGMATEDIVTVAGALGDLSNFPKVADRLQQGLLNELFLGRLMIHPRGLVSKRAFRFDSGDTNPEQLPDSEKNDTVPESSTLEPVIKTGPNVRAWYRGISQGGIMGGALMALAPDFDKGSLGVAAMNYSVLLTRSGAWDTYSAFFNPAYTNQVERPLALSIVQMLWDRGEPNGYAHRMTTDPLPGTPPHQVLFDLAFGDHLVTNWQSNVEARTVGARALTPFVADGRWPGVDGDWGIDPVESWPYDGSVVAYWDSGPLRPGSGPGDEIGTDPPPVTNTAPVSGEDPHEFPRVSDTAVEMIDGFLRNGGVVTNLCAPGPCLAGGWTGS